MAVSPDTCWRALIVNGRRYRRRCGKPLPCPDHDPIECMMAESHEFLEMADGD